MNVSLRYCPRCEDNQLARPLAYEEMMFLLARDHWPVHTPTPEHGEWWICLRCRRLYQRVTTWVEAPAEVLGSFLPRWAKPD